MKQNWLYGVLIAYISFGPEHMNAKRSASDAFYSYCGQHTFLLSYPRSGNTWVRYWLEYITKRPTFYRLSQDPKDQPLACIAGSDFEINPLLPPIEKVHERNEIKADMKYDILIVIVRNPKEALARQGHKLITCSFLSGVGCQGHVDPRIYFDILQLYSEWDPQRRIMVFYEDMVAYPRKTIDTVISFLGNSCEKVDEFMKNYAFHRANALRIYKEAESKGEDLLYHSRKLSPEYRKQIDGWIEQLYPVAWKEVLAARYAEERLQYD